MCAEPDYLSKAIPVEIFELITGRVHLSLPLSGKMGSNRIHLLTGPNGSGKTEALTNLVTVFTSAHMPRETSLTWRHRNVTHTLSARMPHVARPNRLITQTFSPFNRFPAPKRSNESLTDVYGDGVERQLLHIPIGLHRQSKLSGNSVSRETLEQAIFRLSESKESAGAIFQVMRYLGFFSRFRFGYARTARLQMIRSKQQRNELVGYLADLLERKGRPGDGLVQELHKTDPVRLAELVSEALNQLDLIEERNSLTEERSSEERSTLIWQEFDLERSSRQFAQVQSLALLRRLDLLFLRECRIFPFEGKDIEVTNASSGQQQMLCSIIGLATALGNNSLVLIDEPELSLHPQWQQYYLEYLGAALSPFRDCHVLVATHSPLIVQQAQLMGLGVVRVGKLASEVPRISDSASVEATLVDVFETPVSESTYLANEILAAINQAEEGVAEKNVALADLGRLQRVYSSSHGENGKSLELIKDAVDLLNSDL